MKEVLKILNELTPKQKKEFDSDMQKLYLECHRILNGKLEKLKDVSVNLNINNEVYLNVVCEYDNNIKSLEQVKGRITYLKK
ncbi:hypothetical protein C1T31_10130 [Hanstruepera neustonica]|uniref:Uncharacterized protein n=1 Tax=Hanstruepera neustonica TaxID=1445657 RepID=A0A2K1DXW0_9FLAO|nr:hypothetical protein [Hanstruepera neustonica]PNQ72853.1 hypothetical protein C1T31_10130 [Hanstruepera neustonica]